VKAKEEKKMKKKTREGEEGTDLYSSHEGNYGKSSGTRKNRGGVSSLLKLLQSGSKKKRDQGGGGHSTKKKGKEGGRGAQSLITSSFYNLEKKKEVEV